MRIGEFRQYFPLSEKVVYFDNAATSLTPEPVLAKVNEYYREYKANIHRGAHRLTEKASDEYEAVYDKLAHFFSAKPTEFINVRNTTEAINFVSMGQDFSNRMTVVTTDIEHHSNLLPWIKMRNEGKISMKYVPVSSEGAVDMDSFSQSLGEDTGLVTITAASNVLGNRMPVKLMTKIAHDAGALVLIDAAQAVGHMKVDLHDWGADYMAFSGHKCFGTTGAGVLFHREGTNLEPEMLGGGTVQEVTLDDYHLTKDRQRFEAGTPDIGGWIGLGAAIDFISKHSEFMAEHERLLVKEMMLIAEIPGVHYYGPRSAEHKNPVFSFNVGKLKHHEVAVMFDKMSKICLRSGHHCAMPLHHKVLRVDGSVRASLHAYNTQEEVKLFFETLEKISALA